MVVTGFFAQWYMVWLPLRQVVKQNAIKFRQLIETSAYMSPVHWQTFELSCLNDAALTLYRVVMQLNTG